jgi:hypothetical protein
MPTPRTRRPVAAGRRAWTTSEQSGNHSVRFYNAAGQHCGQLQRGWLEKAADPAKHLLRTRNAWALDQAHLDSLRQAGGVGVRIHCPGSVVYEATLASFDAYGFDVDYGWGRQRGLALVHWRQRVAGQARLWDDLP